MSKKVISNLSSSLLKKKLMKSENCRYCNTYAEKNKLIYHLRKHANCANLYMRENKLKTRVLLIIVERSSVQILWGRDRNFTKITKVLCSIQFLVLN